MTKVIILLLILNFTIFAEIAIKTIGEAPSEAEAKEISLKNLTQALKLDNKTDFNSYFLGVQTTTQQNDNEYLVESSLEKESGILYKNRLTELENSINKDLDFIKTSDVDDKIDIYNKIMEKLNLFENYKKIAIFLGITDIPNPKITYSQVEEAINNLKKTKENSFTVYVVNSGIENYDKNIVNILLNFILSTIFPKIGTSQNEEDEINFNYFAANKIEEGLLKNSKFIVTESSGANYSIINSVSYDERVSPPTYDSHGNLMFSAKCEVFITLDVTIMDNTNNKILASRTFFGHGDDSADKDRNYSVGKAIKSGISYPINEAISFIDKQLLIESSVLKYITDKEVFINKGANFGVKKGMDFEIFTKDDLEKRNKVGIIRITDVFRTSSKGRIFNKTQDAAVIENGFGLKESPVANALQGNIIEKDYLKVTLDVGKKMSVKKGEIFEVLDKEKKTLKTKTNKKTSVCITDVFDDYSVGKILTGVSNVKNNENLAVIEDKKAFHSNKIDVSYGVVPFNITENIKLGTSDSLAEESSYSGNYLRVSYNKFYPLYNLNTSAGFKFTQTGAENLDYYTLYFGSDYYISIIPEFVYLYPGVSLGFGITSADYEALENTQYSSGNKASKAPSAGILELGVKFGASLEISRFSLKTELFYNFLKMNKWSYSNSERVVTINNECVRYPSLSSKGAGISLSLGYKF